MLNDLTMIFQKFTLSNYEKLKYKEKKMKENEYNYYSILFL